MFLQRWWISASEGVSVHCVLQYCVDMQSTFSDSSHKNVHPIHSFCIFAVCLQQHRFSFCPGFSSWAFAYTEDPAVDKVTGLLMLGVKVALVVRAAVYSMNLPAVQKHYMNYNICKCYLIMLLLEKITEINVLVTEHKGLVNNSVFLSMNQIVTIWL